jgi:FkbH-like protein
MKGRVRLVLTSDVCLDRAKAAANRETWAEALRWACAVTDTSEELVDWMAATAVLRRSLRHEDSLPRKARVAVLGSYTTRQLVQLLPLAAARCGVDVELYEGGYDQYRQEILDPRGGLVEFRPDVVILAVHAGALSLPEFSDTPDEEVDREVSQWTSLWQAIADRTGARVIQHTFAVPVDIALGHLMARTPGSRHVMSQRVNVRLGEAASATAGQVAVVDCDALASSVGKRTWFDARYWYRSKQAVSLACLPLLARHTAAVIAGSLGRARKCLVLDLDNTVWGGILGEDGMAGIQLGAGAVGEAFSAFQSFAIDLKARGVILAVCSKNNPDDVVEVFEKHPDMRLTLDDIALLSAGWDDKASQLRRIASTLSLGLDALVFADDNPAEREVIRQLVPEIDVIELPADPAGYVRALAEYPFFEPAALTSEDASRTDMYRARARTVELADQASSLDDFLSSLAMVATPVAADEVTLPRISQLIGKTNQFNLTGRRRSLSEVEALAADPAWSVIGVRLRDCFADHGLVGVLLGHAEAGVLTVDTWLLSCRVIGRTLEDEMLLIAAEHARNAGCSTIRGSYVPSGKNVLVSELYPRLGFAPDTAVTEGDAEAATHWTLAVDGVPASPGFITVEQP